MFSISGAALEISSSTSFPQFRESDEQSRLRLVKSSGVTRMHSGKSSTVRKQLRRLNGAKVRRSNTSRKQRSSSI